jgi:predicted DNA-binding protein (MmcQ/YjbR family)
MRRDDVLHYCLSLPGAWQDEPWEESIVAKVGSRIFAFFGSFDGDGVGVKCGTGRDEADEWIDRFPNDVEPMPYLARSGWNSLKVGGAIPDDDLIGAIDGSYAYVVSRLRVSERPLDAGRPRPAHLVGGDGDD